MAVACWLAIVSFSRTARAWKSITPIRSIRKAPDWRPAHWGFSRTQHEVTAAYVYRHTLRHFTPFLEAGVGGLVFAPTDAPAASTQARAAFVYGARADFNVTKRVFVRVECPGLVYNGPTLDLTSESGADRVTHRAEPSINRVWLRILTCASALDAKRLLAMKAGDR
jgi:hypothetical protein